MPDSAGDRVPLMMGDKIIGEIRFDLETGEITGKLSDSKLSPLLSDLFGEGLMGVSFYGEPSVPIPEARKKIDEFVGR